MLEEDTDTTDGDTESESETFFTSAGQMSTAYTKDITNTLNNSAFVHSLSAYQQQNSDTKGHSFVASEQKRYGPSQFYGLMIDTGASQRSTVGYDQYLAYTTTIAADALMDKTTEGDVNIKFGIGSTSSIGSIVVHSPVGTVEFYIIQADTPFLLSLADMDRLQIQFLNLKNVLQTTQGDIPVVRRFGHAFLLWNESLYAFVQESLQCTTPSCFLTEPELRRLHKRFGHPSVQRLHRVLERSGHEVDRDIL